MEVLLNNLKIIEVEHRWWSPEIFLRLENETLKRKVKELLTDNKYILTLAAYGTTKEIQDFAASLHEQTPLMIVSVLACFLDAMFLQETMNLPISREIVEWYRKEGWQFPKFQCETTGSHETTRSID
jgi:hypothetical protein